MLILDPTTGKNVEIAMAPRTPPTRLEDRETVKAAIHAEKERLRAERYRSIRQAELDAGAL